MNVLIRAGFAIVGSALAVGTMPASAHPLPARSFTSRAGHVIAPHALRRILTAQSGCTSVAITDPTNYYYPGVTAANVYSRPIKNMTLATTATDGTFCDVQLYVPPTAKFATISGSQIANGRLVGILVSGATNVKIMHTTVSTIGDGFMPGDIGLYGYQDGIGIDFESGSGQVDYNLLLNYQKNGTEFYNATIEFDHNTAIGTYGPPNTSVFNNGYDVIAQNGFEADNSTVIESHNAAYSNQYYNLNDQTYNREASGFLFGADMADGSPFTCANFTTDQDVAPSDFFTGVGNDIPFYGFPDYTYSGCPPNTGRPWNPTPSY